jgi:Trypsin-like peptidase domain
MTRETSAVLRVGDGRGFVVECRGYRVVITAAHCLPHFPPPHAASYLKERTYPKLLGPLSGRRRTAWAECLFVDPIADIAVLGQPDNQELSDEADAYDRLVDGMAALAVADAPAQGVKLVKRPALGDLEAETFKVPTPGEGSARLLALDGRWFECRVRHTGGGLWLHECKQPIAGGMSGSPVLDKDGAAIGVVSVAGGVSGEPLLQGGPNPNLTRDLPAKFLPR